MNGVPADGGVCVGPLAPAGGGVRGRVHLGHDDHAALPRVRDHRLHVRLEVQLPGMQIATGVRRQNDVN